MRWIISDVTPQQNKPVRRRPPRTLQLPAKNEEGQGEDQVTLNALLPPAARSGAGWRCMVLVTVNYSDIISAYY